MNKWITIIAVFLASKSFATDFNVSYLTDYETIVYCKVIRTSQSMLDIEIIDTLKLSGAPLAKGMKLSVYYGNYYYFDFEEERDAILTLTQNEGNWRANGIIAGNEEDEFKLSFRNRISSITVDVKEVAEGIKLIFKCLTIHPKTERNIYKPFNRVSLKESENKLKQAIADNVFVKHLFKEWDFFQCFTMPLSFGFWPDLERKRDSLIQRQQHVRVIPFGDNASSDHPLFTRFQTIDSLKHITKDYLYFFDPLLDTFRRVYDFTPDSTLIAPENASVIWINNYGYHGDYFPSRTLFGDSYFTNLSGLSTLDGYKQLVLPVYSVSGILNYYSSNDDTLIAQLTNGKFTGKLKYYTKNTFYEMNFNNKGQAHGPSFRSTHEMGEIIHYEHFTNNTRSGHYFSNFPNGQTYQSGSYYENKRIGTWLEYYDPSEGGKLKSKNNYTYFDNSIENHVQDTLRRPTLLSNWCIDEENWRRLHGYQIYYDTDGNKISFQRWENGALQVRQDWYVQRSDSLVFDSLQGMQHVSYNTAYHTSGEYKNNHPWYGTFLVGASELNSRLGSAGGWRPHIRISVDTYQNGQVVNQILIYDSHPRPLHWSSDIPKIVGKPVDPNAVFPKKKRLFKRKKKYVTTCGGNVIEVPRERKKKKNDGNSSQLFNR